MTGYDRDYLHVVDNAATAARVLYHLLGPPGEEPLVSLDTETTGCNPKKESPVGRAKLWCMTLAWMQGDTVATAFIPAEWVGAFRAWLECKAYRKVGQNIFGYDRHVLRNAGIELRGIVGDTQRMSRLLNPAKDGGHGLKDQARALGIEMVDYAETVATVWHGKVKQPTAKEGARTPVNFAKQGESDVETLWQTAWRRPQIIDYAVLDAVAGLLVHTDNERKLRERVW